MARDGKEQRVKELKLRLQSGKRVRRGGQRMKCFSITHKALLIIWKVS